MVSEWELFIRLVLSCILGGVIGYERQSRRKSAGLRTNILVCLGSCLIMVLSINIYQSVQGLTNADPARLAAQVVSGIGFLGAGTIMKEGLTVRGLTTAAGLWVVSGVGLAAGAGYYTGALLTTILVFATLGILSRLDKWQSNDKVMVLDLIMEDAPGQMGRIGYCLGRFSAVINAMEVKPREDGVVTMHVALYNPQGKGNEIVEELMALDGILAIDVL